MQGFDKEIIINAMAKMMDNLFRGDNLRNVKMSTIIQVTEEGLFEVKKSRRDANGSRNNIGQWAGTPYHWRGHTTTKTKCSGGEFVKEGEEIGDVRVEALSTASEG